MLSFKLLLAVAAITTVATTSIAQAAGYTGRKTVQQPNIFTSEMVRGSHAEFGTTVPAFSYQGTRGQSSPAGRS